MIIYNMTHFHIGFYIYMKFHNFVVRNLLSKIKIPQRIKDFV
jgi:hypothetical protein